MIWNISRCLTIAIIRFERKKALNTSCEENDSKGSIPLAESTRFENRFNLIGLLEITRSEKSMFPLVELFERFDMSSSHTHTVDILIRSLERKSRAIVGLRGAMRGSGACQTNRRVGIPRRNGCRSQIGVSLRVWRIIRWNSISCLFYSSIPANRRRKAV